MLHHWYSGTDKGEIMGVLFVDYSKAFDLVNHKILVQDFQEIALLGVDTLVIR